MSRASPLSPELRRAAIIAATEKLIVDQGGSVSTRAIAEAAGIAEGTIFRVFPTKEAIIAAVFEDAFNRDAYVAQLGAIDLGGDLRTRMVAVATLFQNRISRIMALYTALGFSQRPSMRTRPEPSFQEVAAVLEPDRDLLRISPLEAARALQTMVMAQSIPMLGGMGPLTASPEEIVDLILHGIARLPDSQKENLAC